VNVVPLEMEIDESVLTRIPFVDARSLAGD
jgi:hypothetical protein